MVTTIFFSLLITLQILPHHRACTCLNFSANKVSHTLALPFPPVHHPPAVTAPTSPVSFWPVFWSSHFQASGRVRGFGDTQMAQPDPCFWAHAVQQEGQSHEDRIFSKWSLFYLSGNIKILHWKGKHIILCGVIKKGFTEEVTFTKVLKTCTGAFTNHYEDKKELCSHQA